ncbi:putative oxidoreductase ZK1290.5 [Saccoglossus kowalevskii]|uniref:Uncharacterized oxidoreductase ZK1290.5-like n=1 Tax=Saccoglossus kowalevskii TaxID=10224 RepID=A0ABM0GUE7_SACKO|nr:PREDICTED: uncharacterized oxidoreductase ZK1290.5-like [Saccoglossus kowalevskii]
MTAPKTKTVRLSNGVKIPILGLGTSHIGGYCHSTVVHALKDCGYRLIDTAARYKCEEAVGKAIRESNVPRKDIFLTTKLWKSELGYKKTIDAFSASLQRLKVEYIDLYLIHWPVCPHGSNNVKSLRAETWKAMEELYKQGLCKAIGVSNFEVSHLRDLEETWDIIPHVNQIEHHIYYRPMELIQYCKDKGICVEGYCPLSQGLALEEPIIQELANKYKKTKSQILIRWNIQNDVVTIPKTTKESRVHENFQVFDFEIHEEDMQRVNSIHKTKMKKLILS